MDWFAPSFEVAIQLAWHPSRWHGPALTAISEASQACISDALEDAIDDPSPVQLMEHPGW